MFDNGAFKSQFIRAKPTDANIQSYFNLYLNRAIFYEFEKLSIHVTQTCMMHLKMQRRIYFGEKTHTFQKVYLTQNI